MSTYLKHSYRKFKKLFNRNLNFKNENFKKDVFLDIFTSTILNGLLKKVLTIHPADEDYSRIKSKFSCVIKKSNNTYYIDITFKDNDKIYYQLNVEMSDYNIIVEFKQYSEMFKVYNSKNQILSPDIAFLVRREDFPTLYNKEEYTEYSERLEYIAENFDLFNCNKKVIKIDGQEFLLKDYRIIKDSILSISFLYINGELLDSSYQWEDSNCFIYIKNENGIYKERKNVFSNNKENMSAGFIRYLNNQGILIENITYEDIAMSKIVNY